MAPRPPTTTRRRRRSSDADADGASLGELERRLREVEHKVDDSPSDDPVLRLTIAALERADEKTAISVDRLNATINDPERGLIIQLRLFREEVQSDRQAFRSWVRGATTVITVVLAGVTIASPWIRTALELALHISASPATP